MRRYVGPAVLLIGVIHVLYVCVTMRRPLTAIARAGVFNAAGSHPDREAAFWSCWFGLLLATVGFLIHRNDARGHIVPTPVGWVLIGLGASGGMLMPVGPFWIAIPLGWRIARPAPDRGSATS